VSSTFGYVVLVSFWTVLVAELVGDKSIYTVGSLSLRFRTRVVYPAIIAAFAGKMLAAVLLGRIVVQLHSRWTDILSAVAFFISALFIWHKEPHPVSAQGPVSSGWPRGAAVSFASLFFTEWGDPGQIAVAALTLKSHALLAPWLGGTLAMAAKGGLAMTIGRKMRDLFPQGVLRIMASASCCLLGILALSGLILP